MIDDELSNHIPPVLIPVSKKSNNNRLNKNKAHYELQGSNSTSTNFSDFSSFINQEELITTSFKLLISPLALLNKLLHRSSCMYCMSVCMGHFSHPVYVIYLYKYM